MVPEGPPKVAGGGAKQNHRIGLLDEFRPGGAAELHGGKLSVGTIHSGAPSGAQPDRAHGSGGSTRASLHHRLISAVPPGRFLRSEFPNYWLFLAADYPVICMNFLIH